MGKPRGSSRARLHAVSQTRHSSCNTLLTPRYPDAAATFLGGSFLSVRFLFGPAQVALHLHKLRGVLLLFLNFLLLHLKLQGEEHDKASVMDRNPLKDP